MKPTTLPPAPMAVDTGTRAQVLIGTSTYHGTTDANRRQQQAVETLVALRNVELVNVQFARSPHEIAGLRTLPRLTLTSNSVTGRRGPTKPIVSEILDVLAGEAAARSLKYICFTNADISFTQHAIDWILEKNRDAYVLSREDFDGASGTASKMETAGADAVAVATLWWQANRSRFRPYIAGEVGWDNVYAAILLCHADALIENRRPLIRHEIHPAGPVPSPHFGEYIRMLCALDAGYFSLWCRYWDGLVRLRAAGASVEEEAAWARDVFVWDPTPVRRLAQAGRNVKARLRYTWWKARAGDAR